MAQPANVNVQTASAKWVSIIMTVFIQHIPQTRQVLRKLIPDQIIQGKLVPGRIVCTPFDNARGQGYTFLAAGGSYSRLLGSGIAINDGGGGQGS